MSGREEHCVVVVKASLSLALTTIAMFERHCPDTKEYKREAFRDNALFNVDVTLQKWIDNPNVIGKAMFGGFTERAWCIRTSYQLARVREEIMVIAYLHQVVIITVFKVQCKLYVPSLYK